MRGVTESVAGFCSAEVVLLCSLIGQSSPAGSVEEDAAISFVGFPSSGSLSVTFTAPPVNVL